MNGTSEEPAPIKRPPGLENLTLAELARLAANSKFREVVRAEFSRRPELLEVMCQGCGKCLRLPGSEPSGPNCRYICKECSRGTSGYCEEVYDQYRSEQGKETSRRWRSDHKEEAAEDKRRRRAGDSYVESRKDLMSDAAWEAKLKEFDNACSSCGRSLTLKTAIRWPSGPTYVPVCSRCRGKKAAEERWRKEKKLEQQ